MISGVIDKNSLGEGKTTSLLQRIVRDYGPNRARMFLDDAVGMLLYVILINGLTIGVDEVDIGTARSKVKEEVEKTYDRASELIKAYYEEDEKILHLVLRVEH